MEPHQFTVTKFEYCRYLDKWLIELDNGLVKATAKIKPDYKLGDKIVSPLWGFDNHIESCNPPTFIKNPKLSW